MAVDRDLAVAFARARFPAGSARGWEMLAATGVRGLRLLVESGAFRSMRLTEAHPVAFAVLRRNAEGLVGATPAPDDARERPPDAPFDYVDADPYGSPLPFLAPALAAVADGGVLALTATDLMVLAGAQSAACERRYGSRPVRGRLGPEGGLRILLAHVARVARGQGRRVRPLLAYARGHHLRGYFEVRPAGPGPSDDPIEVVRSDTWTGPPLGDGGPFGPLWTGPLFDRALVERMDVPPSAAHPKEVRLLLDRLREEALVDRPFYYESNALAATLGLRQPPPYVALNRALTGRGYRCVRTHMRPEGFRTDAPRSVVEDVARTLDAARG
jgi:tRNA (guanine26-N2/guanine27-N2)-dimethyltransferase